MTEMRDSTFGTSDRPAVIAPPPVLFLGYIMLGVVLDLIWPSSLPIGDMKYAAGLVTFGLGVALLAWSLLLFRRAGTNVETRKPTHALVISGPYSISRNPIYIALSLIHLGIGVLSDSLWVVGLIVPALLTIRYGVIAREERYLDAKFGDDYRRYKASVRRWL